MAFPLVPLILGASTVVGGHLTRQTVASGLRSGLSQFGQSLPFGAGYSFGTYIGFPKNYQQQSNTYTPKSFTLSNEMPYGYYPRRRYNSRYSRYGSRRFTRYSRFGRRRRSYSTRRRYY